MVWEDGGVIPPPTQFPRVIPCSPSPPKWRLCSNAPQNSAPRGRAGARRNPRPGPCPAQALSYVTAPPTQGPGRRVAVASYWIAPGFTVRPGPRPAPDTVLDADFAVLQLDPSVPAAPQEFVLPLVAGLMPQWTVLAFGGYQPDLGLGLVADLECWVIGYGRFMNARTMLRHSCAATVGSSGGPLLVRTTEGAWMVAGVGSLAITNDIGGWAVPSLTITRALAEMTR